MERKRKCVEKNKRHAKKRCTEESFSQRGETSQDIVQDVPVETDDPCTTSSGHLPEKKTLKKGKKRGKTSPEKGDETPNKRRRKVESQTTSPSEQVNTCLSLKSLTFTRKLGEGCFGKVMLATHQPSRLQLAVKMVRKRELLENAKDSLRLEREVLKITEDSRFFTHAYGTFQTVDYACYAMEYLRGGELTEFIKSRAPLHVRTSRFLAAEILSGIEFLHSRGIIHRDLKPDNILLDGDGHAKISDFGLAAMNVFGSQKIKGSFGTPGYMAPEIIHGQPYNYTVDLFAFGVIIFQMATGSHPFYNGQCPRRIARSVAHDKPNYPNTIDSQIKDVIATLLCKSPKKRQGLCRNLKEHPLFLPINWEELEAGRSRPPFRVRPIPCLETSEQFELHQMMSGTEARKPPITPKDQRLFRGFSYMSKRWKSITSRSNNNNANTT